MRMALMVSLVLVIGLTPGLAQTAADEMAAGIEAYKSAQYEQAIAHFTKALQFEPGLATAHLYLGIAHAQQYIPGADSADNNKEGESALKQLALAVAANLDPEQHVDALRARASLLFNMKKFDEAKADYEELIKLDPDDPDFYYSIAVIDWTQSYTPRMELRKSMNLEPTDELEVGSACNLLRSMNEKKVEDGIQKLTKAIDLRCDFDDAMAYMNLMYREKADYECDTPELRAYDLKMADEWIDRTIAAKKAKAEQAAKSSPE